MSCQKFDWGGSSVVVRSYGDIAVYINPHGDIVLRQNDTFDPDDQLVIVPVGNAKLVADAILRCLRESAEMAAEEAEERRTAAQEPPLALPAPRTKPGAA